MSLALGARYARALADIAFDSANPVDADQLGVELGSLTEQFGSSAILRDALTSPAVPLARKRAVAAKIIEALNLSPTSRNFLFVTIEHGRLSLLRVIYESYLRIIDERRGIVQATVSAAVELDENQRRQFGENLAALTGKQMRLAFQKDPALLGGAVVRIGSQVYDGSVRGRLASLEEKLTRPS
jgi:F-type H+-transporting ATPase subunit delta